MCVCIYKTRRCQHAGQQLQKEIKQPVAFWDISLLQYIQQLVMLHFFYRNEAYGLFFYSCLEV